jgi:hypothetical protein
MMAAAKQNGATVSDPMDAAMQMLQHPNPKVREAGGHLFDANQKVLAYQQDKSFINRAAPQPIQATQLPPAPGAQTNFGLNDNSMKAWMADKTTNLDFKPWLEQQNAKQTNALAPTPVAAAAAPAPTNALATSSKADQLLAEINDLRARFPYSAKAKEQITFLTKQYEEATKPHVVGRNLVTGGGDTIFTAPQDVTPSELQKYIDERNRLVAKNPNDPNIAMYDRQIKDMGLARERLNFDRDKFAWEKANPGYTIQQTENGDIVGVNNRTLQAFPVTLGGAAPPPVVPFAPGQAGRTVAPAPGGAGNRGNAVVTPSAEPIIQPRGEQLKGKSAGMTESQGNATAFGMRMKESHAALKNLESKGETGTGVVRGTVGGVVGLVPFVGDKFTAATDDIFNVLPGILGGMSPEQQQVVNGRINFITAVLRKESGAAISPGEFITAEKLYFPKPGDDATVIKQKQKARELAIKAMEIQAGPGAKSIQGLTPSTSSGTSASDPLGLFNK